MVILMNLNLASGPAPNQSTWTVHEQTGSSHIPEG